MKKIISLIMVIAMLAAMSVVVWARYELCPDCEVRLSTRTKGITDYDYCERCREEYTITKYYEQQYCKNCGVVQYSTYLYTTGSCPNH